MRRRSLRCHGDRRGCSLSGEFSDQMLRVEAEVEGGGMYVVLISGMDIFAFVVAVATAVAAAAAAARQKSSQSAHLCRRRWPCSRLLWK